MDSLSPVQVVWVMAALTTVMILLALRCGVRPRYRFARPNGSATARPLKRVDWVADPRTVNGVLRSSWILGWQVECRNFWADEPAPSLRPPEVLCLQLPVLTRPARHSSHSPHSPRWVCSRRAPRRPPLGRRRPVIHPRRPFHSSSTTADSNSSLP